MKKAVFKFCGLIIAFTMLGVMSFNYPEIIYEKSTLKQSYYRASCTKTWSDKFPFTKGDREGQKAARKKATEAAKKHENETGHDSGVLGPY